MLVLPCFKELQVVYKASVQNCSYSLLPSSRPMGNGKKFKGPQLRTDGN